MAAQEAEGPQRFIIDDQSIGEAPLASVSMLTLPGNASSPAKARKDEAEEMVLYVLDGGFKLGTEAVKAGDVVWLGAHTDRPALTPADKKPLKLLEIRAHGDGTGQKIVHAADAKDYKIAGGKGTAKLLLDGSGAKLAVDLDRGRRRRGHPVAQARARRRRISSSSPGARRRRWARRPSRRRRATPCASRRTRRTR